MGRCRVKRVSRLVEIGPVKEACWTEPAEDDEEVRKIEAVINERVSC